MIYEVGPVLVFKRDTEFKGAGGRCLHFSANSDREKRFFFGYDWVRGVYGSNGITFWNNWEYSQDRKPAVDSGNLAIWFSERVLYARRQSSNDFDLSALTEESGIMEKFGKVIPTGSLEFVSTSEGTKLWAPEKNKKLI